MAVIHFNYTSPDKAEYENNTSKNSLDNRLNSLCKAIEKKYDKYTRISQL